MGGQWSECNLPSPSEETCNAADDDCDGFIDEESKTILEYKLKFVTQ